MTPNKPSLDIQTETFINCLLWHNQRSDFIVGQLLEIHNMFYIGVKLLEHVSIVKEVPLKFRVQPYYTWWYMCWNQIHFATAPSKLLVEHCVIKELQLLRNVHKNFTLEVNLVVIYFGSIS